MKKIKPVIFLIPENTNEVFIDVEKFVAWKNESPVNESYCRYGALVLGRQIFVFDVNSCDFLIPESMRHLKSILRRANELILSEKTVVIKEPAGKRNEG